MTFQSEDLNKLKQSFMRVLLFPFSTLMIAKCVLIIDLPIPPTGGGVI